jgi:hypothetical protein
VKIRAFPMGGVKEKEVILEEIGWMQVEGLKEGKKHGWTDEREMG